MYKKRPYLLIAPSTLIQMTILFGSIPDSLEHSCNLRKWIWNRLFFFSLVELASNPLGKEPADTESMASRMLATKVVWWWEYFYKESGWRVGAFRSIWSPVDFSRGCLVYRYRKIASWLLWWNTCEKIRPQDGIQIKLQSTVATMASKSLWNPNKEKNWYLEIQSKNIFDSQFYLQ